MAVHPMSEPDPYPGPLGAATALPPWSFAAPVFRAAVCAYPEDVWLEAPDLHGDPDARIRVSDLHPGTRILVNGSRDNGHRWQVILTCDQAGQFAVSRAPAAPPEDL
jgi:hypothetical protein